ncbi:hypothetical protein FRX31_013582 [Thalictrum thalictroides]|uniref:Uncharacterized protein n=1 Tax=Thalictrum thalictroides TaxID=46969 RepID=A0A7J6WJP8_THATH|nr:hypothetical protein FRX31_013582 [Thalictrum thalictroides]
MEIVNAPMLHKSICLNKSNQVVDHVLSDHLHLPYYSFHLTLGTVTTDKVSGKLHHWCYGENLLVLKVVVMRLLIQCCKNASH